MKKFESKAKVHNQKGHRKHYIFIFKNIDLRNSMHSKNKWVFKLIRLFGGLLLCFTILFGLFIWRIQIPDPEIKSNKTTASYKRIKISTNHYTIGNCWLKKNKYGIWEMYLEGSPYERGLIYGMLSKELMEKQEVAFVDQINEIIPNRFFLQFIKAFVGWFNKDIYKYIPEENQQEIFGISQSFSDKYDYIGPKYYRILNYHAAHDIGHALTDLNMVGCTSFSVNNGLSADSSLLIGRNFDFYMGDAFAEDKLIVFMKPDKGHAFASYAWAGLSGVVSGMNDKGLTVTLNASKSDIPYGAKDPISLLAREILQYAQSIDEAIAIAQKRETFVSESLLIGSAIDNKSIIIEKSPLKMDVFDSGTNLLVCANHYQSKLFVNDTVNLKNMRESDSNFRFKRMESLLRENFPVGTADAIGILRNQFAENDKFVGYGNPKVLNQLIAHHGIIFKPAQKMLWISAPPYQLGNFVSYDITNLAHNFGKSVLVDSMVVPADGFLLTNDFQKYEDFKITRHHINKFVNMGIPLDLTEKEQTIFIAQNKESFLTYLALGDYHYAKGNYQRALFYFKTALTHETSSLNDTNAIYEKIKKCNLKI